MSVPEDFACCALKEGHGGCCAFRCSDCFGSGRCLGPCGGMDDLGCDWCEGTGHCVECGGQGWFNEFGDPCWVTPDEVAK